MKLNPDCIRAVMLKVEELHEVTVDDSYIVTIGTLWFADLCAELPKYTKEDIFYSLYNLDQAGYLDISTFDAENTTTLCAVNAMTYAGHEFLEKIRDTKQWSLVKGAMGAVRNYSLDAINAIASGVTNAAISAYLERNPS